jgi:hypothetical protein
MVPLSAARIEDLGPGDLVKVNCATCRRRLLLSSAELRCSDTALLTSAFLRRLGLDPRLKVLNLTAHGRCDAGGRGSIGIRWTETAAQGV